MIKERMSWMSECVGKVWNYENRWWHEPCHCETETSDSWKFDVCVPIGEKNYNWQGRGMTLTLVLSMAAIQAKERLFQVGWIEKMLQMLTIVCLSRCNLSACHEERQLRGLSNCTYWCLEPWDLCVLGCWQWSSDTQTLGYLEAVLPEATPKAHCSFTADSYLCKSPTRVLKGKMHHVPDWCGLTGCIWSFYKMFSFKHIKSKWSGVLRNLQYKQSN